MQFFFDGPFIHYADFSIIDGQNQFETVFNVGREFVKIFNLNTQAAVKSQQYNWMKWANWMPLCILDKIKEMNRSIDLSSFSSYFVWLHSSRNAIITLINRWCDFFPLDFTNFTVENQFHYRFTRARISNCTKPIYFTKPQNHKNDIHFVLNIQ